MSNNRQTDDSVDLQVGKGYPIGRCVARSKTQIALHPEGPYELQRCSLPVVPNMRVCRLHGGLSPGRPITTGSRYMRDYHIPVRMRQRFDEFVNDPTWANTSHEIALLRVMVDDYMERHGDNEDEDEAMQKHISSMIEKIALLVEKKHKQEYGETHIVNVNTLVAYAARIADIIKKYISDEETLILIGQDLSRLFAGRDPNEMRMLANGETT